MINVIFGGTMRRADWDTLVAADSLFPYIRYRRTARSVLFNPTEETVAKYWLKTLVNYGLLTPVEFKRLLGLVGTR